MLPTRTIVKPSTHRNGFHSIRKTDPDLYKQIRGHIRTCFDLTDWGYLHQNGSSKPRANKKESINLFRQGFESVGRPRELSLRRIESHCDGIQTIYACSSPTSSYAVLLIDIDDKDGSAGDAKRLFQFFSDLFTIDCGTIYGEPSTFGKGYHGYLFIRYDAMDRSAFRATGRLLERTLRRLAADHGFKSSVEIKGIPGLLNADRTYRTCGLLAKLPRLASADHWRDYLNRPVYSADFLLNFMRQFGVQIDAKPESQSGAQNLGSATSCSHILSTEREGREKDSLSAVGDDRQRMRECGWNLCCELGRACTEPELWKTYHDQGLATGDDHDGNRRRLCSITALLLQRDFDPAKQRKIGFEQRRSELDRLIREHVTADIRQQIRKKNRSKYTDEQLAVVLYVVERSATTRHAQPKYQFTVPNNSIVAMFDTLDIVLDDDGETQRKKLAAMKQVLTAAGLIEPLDQGAWYVQKGKTFTLGAVHPMRNRVIESDDPITLSTFAAAGSSVP